ncbi:hypothetical protein M2275_007783 [Rhodococcus opacus]|nr:hypothetical protein [Rhodococcus opacus]
MTLKCPHPRPRYGRRTRKRPCERIGLLATVASDRNPATQHGQWNSSRRRSPREVGTSAANPSRRSGSWPRNSPAPANPRSMRQPTSPPRRRDRSAPTAATNRRSRTANPPTEPPTRRNPRNSSSIVTVQSITRKRTHPVFPTKRLAEPSLPPTTWATQARRPWPLRAGGEVPARMVRSRQTRCPPHQRRRPRLLLPTQRMDLPASAHGLRHHQGPPRPIRHWTPRAHPSDLQPIQVPEGE